MSNRFNRAAEFSRDLMRTGVTPVLQPIDLNGMVNSFRTAYNDAQRNNLRQQRLQYLQNGGWADPDDLTRQAQAGAVRSMY